MKFFNRNKLVFLILLALIIGGFAWVLRWKAVTTLPIDYDEDDYIRAAQQYAALMRSGDWIDFTQTNYRPEHPPLAKIIYGVGLLQTPEKTLLRDLSSSADPNIYIPRMLLRADRTTSAIFGTLEVFFLALVNPGGGLFLALHTTTIKYTSQVMLESVPALTSLLSIICYIQSKRKWTSKGSIKQMNGWLVFSAVFLGLTAASKYIYCVVGFAILMDLFLFSREQEEGRRFFPLAFSWGAIALFVFFAANPYLWPDPYGRLKFSVLFNTSYSTGEHVQQAGYPIWQAFDWMSKSVPWEGNRSAFVIAIDALIFLFAIFGLSQLWKRERVYVLWLVMASLFLLVWPTKWPQYILILTAPLCFAASEGAGMLVIRPLWNWISSLRASQRKSIHPRSQLRQALPWLLPGLLIFALLTLVPLLFQVGVSLTNFASNSLRDGLHGGLLQTIWAGLTGQVKVAADGIQNGSVKQVGYLGLRAYPFVLDRLVGSDLLFNNVLWTVLSVTLQTVLGLGIALLLWQRGLLFKKFWQTLFILPWAIPEFIGALMWVNIFLPKWGWLALAVEKFGQKFPLAFLNNWDSPNILLLVLLIPAVWYGFPFMMLAARAGLKMVPNDVFDAAAIDGANAWQTFRSVTWPLLQPLLLPAIIVRGIFAFNQFYLFQAFFGPSDIGTLANTSYNTFYSGQYFVSAVINVIAVVFLIGFVYLFNRWSHASEGVGYA